MLIGFNIVKRAFEEPIRQIASNAGWESSIVVEKVKEMKQDMGFNALNEKFPGGIESHRVMLEKEGFKTRPFVLR